MRRSLVFFAVLALPVLLFLNVHQAFMHHRMERRISELEASQSNALEKNKRAIAWLTVLRSPARIEALAREEFGLRRPSGEDVLVIQTVRR